MKVPKKITPDRIRDSIVQVFFVANLPYEPLIGYCYSALLEIGWHYSKGMMPSPQQSDIVIEISSSPQYFFIKDQVKMQISNNSLVFNCTNKYIGWEAYSESIRSVLNKLVDTEILKSFTRVGIRYISEFANVDMSENIRLAFSLEGVEGNVASSIFRITYQDENITKTVNIANKVPVKARLQNNLKESVRFVSLIDIDVVEQRINAQTAGEVWAYIDKLHLKEKEVFFGLLEDKFLQTLNPEYA